MKHIFYLVVPNNLRTPFIIETEKVQGLITLEKDFEGRVLRLFGSEENIRETFPQYEIRDYYDYHKWR